MGDEPYAALLPWVVFAVVDRAHGGGPLWAGIGALITAVDAARHELARDRASRNVIDARRSRRGSARWPSPARCTASDTGFLAHDGRALSAAGFAVIAFGSLAFSPGGRVLHAPARPVEPLGRPRLPPRQRADHA